MTRISSGRKKAKKKTLIPKNLTDLVVKCHYEGLKSPKIAEIVTEKGFKTRLGTLYTPDTIGAILRRSGIRKRGHYNTPARHPAATPHRAIIRKDVLSAVKSILSLHMDPSERIALALMVMD